MGKVWCLIFQWPNKLEIIPRYYILACQHTPPLKEGSGGKNVPNMISTVLFRETCPVSIFVCPKKFRRAVFEKMAKISQNMPKIMNILVIFDLKDYKFSMKNGLFLSVWVYIYGTGAIWMVFRHKNTKE